MHSLTAENIASEPKICGVEWRGRGECTAQERMPAPIQNTRLASSSLDRHVHLIRGRQHCRGRVRKRIGRRTDSKVSKGWDGQER